MIRKIIITPRQYTVCEPGEDFEDVKEVTHELCTTQVFWNDPYQVVDLEMDEIPACVKHHSEKEMQPMSVEESIANDLYNYFDSLSGCDTEEEKAEVIESYTELVKEYNEKFLDTFIAIATHGKLVEKFYPESLIPFDLPEDDGEDDEDDDE